MFILRTVNTSPHRHLLAHFDQITCEAFSRILGAQLNDLQWRQAKLPAYSGGMGLRAALDCGAATYSTSLLQSQPLVTQTLNSTEDQVDAVQAEVTEEPLSPDILATLSIQLSEEVSAESISGLSQKMLCAKIDDANLKISPKRYSKKANMNVHAWHH